MKHLKRYTLAHRLEGHTLVLQSAVCFLFLLFLFFTYHAPDTIMFQDPTRQQALSIR